MTTITSSSPDRSPSHRSTADLAQLYGPPAILFGLLLIDSIVFSGFFAADNFTSIIERSAFVGIIAVGMTYLIIAGGIDLSVGSVAALGGVVIGKFVERGLNPLLALGAVICIGGAIGLVQGVAVVRGRLEPFIVTLAGLLSVRGLALLISGERNVPLPNDGLARALGSGTIVTIGSFDITAPMAAMIVTFGGGAMILRGTTFGRSIYAIGGDERSARLLGVRVDRVKMQAYSLSGALAALAGGLLAFWQTLGRPFAAEAYELQAIGAVVVGGTLLTGGRGSVVGSLFGTMLFFTIQASINWLGLNAFWQQLASGVFLLAVVALQTLLQRRGT